MSLAHRKSVSRLNFYKPIADGSSVGAGKAMRQAAQYLRMSTDQQRYSLANQTELIRVYAERHGFTVVKSYEDAGRSGVTTARRDGLKRLLQDVVAGSQPYATILVVDVSRWGRYQNPDEGAHYEFLCHEAGVSVRYCAEAFDNDDSPTSAIVKSLKRVMAADYSRQLSDRCQAGVRRQALAGFAQGGKAPFGAVRRSFWPDGTPGLVLREGERCSRADQTVKWVRGPAADLKIVRRIFSLVISQGMGASEISRYLNAVGTTYYDHGEWTPSRVKAVLTNEIATGVFVFNKRAGNFPRDPKIASPDTWLRVRIFAPIVSSDTFRAAAEKLRERAGGRWTDDELLARLAALLARKGTLTQPIINDCPRTPGSRAYVRRFGSMEAAFARIGFVPPKVPGRRLTPSAYTKEPILHALRRLHEAKGYLTAALVNADPDLPTARYIRRLFGSLDDAYFDVGFTQTRLERKEAGMIRSSDARTRSAMSMAE